MFNRISQRVYGVASKLHSIITVQLVECRCVLSETKFSVQTHAALTRGYCTINPSAKVTKEYDKLYEDKLNELLKDPKYKAMYDRYKLEIEYLKQVTNRVPKTIKAVHWLNLFEATKKGQRRSYMEFLWKIEKKDEHFAKKKELRRIQREVLQETNEKDDNLYGLQKCTMFYRIRESVMNHFYNGRLMSAMLHEPKIVFDLGFEDTMSPFEQHGCAKQLLLSFSTNRTHDEPFDLHFCNVNKEGIIMQRLHKSIPSLYQPEFPLNITSESYLDIFDKEKLVYLTPHTSNVMSTFDPNLVYIIGAIVDKVNPKPVSFQKARKEGIKMMRLPLGEKLEWGTGSTKNLPLNHVLSILLELRHTNNWNKAFEHVPKRKLRPARLETLQKKIQQREKKLAMLNEEFVYKQ